MHANLQAGLTRLAAATLLSFAAAATLGCSAARGYSLRNDLAALHTQTDADDIGAIDATAPPANLDDYRHARAARYHAVAIERHPVR